MTAERIRKDRSTTRNFPEATFTFSLFIRVLRALRGVFGL
jgi:hypothetical protein